VYGKVVGYVVVREFVYWVRGLLGKVMINGWVLICEIGVLESTYLLMWRAGFPSVVAGTVWYEVSCFTGFYKVVCGYGVWQAGLVGSLLPGSVQVLAVLFGIGFV
jgi:hypothetical protein